MTRWAAQRVADHVPDTRVRAEVRSIEDAAVIAAKLAALLRFDEDEAFVIARSLWDRAKRIPLTGARGVP